MSVGSVGGSSHVGAFSVQQSSGVNHSHGLPGSKDADGDTDGDVTPESAASQASEAQANLTNPGQSLNVVG